MKLSLLTVCCLFFFCNITIGQGGFQNQYNQCVTFIFIKKSSGQIVPQGTAFFTFVGDSAHGRQGYIITAQHVVTDTAGKIFDSIYVRLPRVGDGNLTYVGIPLFQSGSRKNLFWHPDPSVDIAVISTVPRQEVYSFKYLPPNYITTKADFESLRISEGDDVFFTGMFTPFLGEKKNYPIIRFGKVSLITDEKIHWDSHTFTNLYLLETVTYGGNSGSPVYFQLSRKPEQRPNMIIMGNNTIVKLAGIMKGYFNDVQGLHYINTNVTPVVATNMGIAAVTPAYFLWEILHGPELTKVRGF